MPERKRLSDILRDDERRKLADAWATTAAVGEFTPLPAGEYDCRILSGELCSSKSGTPGYKITFEVIEGEHATRHVWHDLWLTPAALPMAKRDLGKLGIDALEKLSQPLPQGILARVKVALLQDDGITYNRVRAFDVTGTEPPDEFAPPAVPAIGCPPPATPAPTEAEEPFPFGANAPTPAATEGTTQPLRAALPAAKPPQEADRDRLDERGYRASR